MVEVAVLGRVVPLAWTLLPHFGSSNFQEQNVILERIRPWLPVAPQKALLGDREFKSIALIRSA